MKYPRIRKTLLLSWTVSYIFMMVLPLLLAIGVYEVGENAIRSGTEALNRQMVHQIKELTDDRIQDMMRIGVQLSQNKTLNAMLGDKPPITSQMRYDAYRLISDFRTYINTTWLVKDFYVYLYNIQKVIGASTYSDEAIGYEYYHTDETWTPEAWFAFLRTYHRDTIHILRGGERPQVAILRTVPTLRSYTAGATLVLVLDTDKLKQTILSMDMPGGSGAFVVDSEGTVLLSTLRDPYAQEIPFDALDGFSGLSQATLHGDPVLLIHETSELTGWKYVAVIPQAYIEQSVLQIRVIAMVLLGIMLLLGAFLAFLLARRNYHPVQSLMRQLNLEHVRDNEYQSIEHALSNILSDAQQKDAVIRKQHSYLRISMLERMLRGGYGASIPLQEVLQTVDLNLDRALYAVWIAVPPESEEPVFKAFRGSVLSCLEAAPDIAAYSVIMDDALALLLNFADRELYEKRVAEILARFEQDPPGFLYLSEVVDSLSAAANAYTQAQELRADQAQARNAIVRRAEKRPRETGELSCPYSRIQEDQLISSLMEGNAYAAEQLLQQLFAQPMSAAVAMCLSHNVIGSVMRAFLGNPSARGSAADIDACLAAVQAASSPQQMQACLTSFAR
ncbi:MAG TPA: cache domain-containing protein, partial [Clostridia bacterium]|nr:cache domain-containing protein [Clostridia bacterium]